MVPPIAEDSSMPYAEHEGVRIHYRDVGSGPPLVLQHGFGQNLTAWYLFGYVELLRQHYRLVLIDARGHGKSSKPHDPAAYTLAQDVGDVLAVLDRLQINQTAFWGYSSGGRTAFGLARWARQRVSAIVIGGQDACARRVPESVRIDPDDPEGSLERIYATTNLSPEGREAVKRQEIHMNDFRALAAAQQDYSSLEDVLPSMNMPCLLYAGELDPVYSGMVDCARAMPGATMAGLPGLTHTSAFWESRTVLNTVLPFLQRLAPAAADAHA